MPKIISGTALRNGYNEVSNWCRETGEPAFVTKNGNGDLAVLSIEAYEELAARLSLYEALAEGFRDVAEGKTVSARSHVADLRERYGLA